MNDTELKIYHKIITDAWTFMKLHGAELTGSHEWWCQLIDEVDVRCSEYKGTDYAGFASKVYVAIMAELSEAEKRSRI